MITSKELLVTCQVTEGRFRQAFGKVHKLGNLTIFGFNSAMGNKCFKDKRDRKDSQGRSVGYKNGLKLNGHPAETDSWSVEQIEARSDVLVDKVMAMFAIK